MLKNIIVIFLFKKSIAILINQIDYKTLDVWKCKKLPKRITAYYLELRMYIFSCLSHPDTIEIWYL
jgi:hypothetical protein